MSKRKKEKLVCLIKFGVPNLNGRVYLNDINVPKKVTIWKNKPFDQMDKNIQNFVGEVQLFKKKDGLYCRPILCNNKYNEMLKYFSIRTSGQGSIEKDSQGRSIIKDYKIDSVFFTNEPA